MVQKVELLEGTNAASAEVELQPHPMWRPRIGGRYLVRQLVTSLPLAIADTSTALLSMLIWQAAGLSLPASVGLALIAAMVCVNALAGLYPGIALGPIGELRRTSVATTAVLSMIAVWLLASQADAAALFVLVGLVAPVALSCMPWFRSVARRLAARSDHWAQPAIIFGSGERAAELFQAMEKNRQIGLRPIGFVDEIEAQWVDTAMHPNWYLGTASEAVDIAANAGVYWAVVTGSVTESQQNSDSRERFASAMPHRLYAPGSIPDSLNETSQRRTIGQLSLLYQCDLLALPVPRLMKRLIDIAISLPLALVVFPVMLIIATLIKLSSPGSAIYAHTRLGRGGKEFKTLKFRTMRRDAAEVLETYLSEHPELRAEWESKQKLTDDPRVTTIGRVLRKSSLDELPQLLNVLKGDMSLVGPRPIVEKEITRYDDVFDDYCRVLPGVAGLWQVSGRNNTTYDERVNYDRYYVQNWSPWMDLYLLARTIKVVVTQDGAY